MRRTTKPDSRLMGAAVGASILAIPGSAAAVGDAPSIQTHVKARTIHFGHDVVVSGDAPSQSGHTVVLEFAPAGTTAWRQIASSRVKPDGRFRLSAPLARSGAVKVIDSSPPTTGFPPSPLAQASAASAASSGPERVSVAAALHVGFRRLDVLGNGAVQVRGRLL